MSRARWIKLYAGIKDSAVWSDPVRLKAWIDILLSANYRDKEWFQNGQTVKVSRGQYVTSIRKLSSAWKCSRDTVRRILKQFDDLDMIRHEVRPGKYTLITVVKYEVFQDGKVGESYTDKATDEDTDKDTDKTTDKATDKDTDTTQHKNIYRNTISDTESIECSPSPSPEGSAVIKKIDVGGPMPEGWNQKLEDTFAENYEVNYKNNPEEATRQDWYDFFGGWDEYK